MSFIKIDVSALQLSESRHWMHGAEKVSFEPTLLYAAVCANVGFRVSGS